MLLRPPNPVDDFDAVLALVQACDRAVYGDSDWTAEELREEWEGLDLARDAWVAVGEGRIAGVVHRYDRRRGRVLADGYVHPELTGRGVGDLLLEAVERRSLELADEVDEATRARLAAGGYAVVRSSFEMERPLDGTLEPPVWPAGLELRPFEEAHARAVQAAQQEAFADHRGFAAETYELWRAHALAQLADVSLWRIAWDGAEVAGVCLNRPRRGEDEDVGWVATLAVRRPWRRRGLGEALLRESFLALAARGKRRAGLSVDAGSTTNAVALYERAGMHVVRRRDTWERVV